MLIYLMRRHILIPTYVQKVIVRIGARQLLLFRSSNRRRNWYVSTHKVDKPSVGRKAVVVWYGSNVP